MCHRCTQNWIPMNHRHSHLDTWCSRFSWNRIYAIRQPFAEVRRQSKMGWRPKRDKAGQSGVGYWQRWMEKFRKQRSTT